MGLTGCGHKAFVEWTVNIKSDVASGKYERWEVDFLEAQEKQQEAKRSMDEPIRRYAVDKYVVWELQIQTNSAIYYWKVEFTD